MALAQLDWIGSSGGGGENTNYEEIVPVMTSSNTPSGYEVIDSAGTASSYAYAPWKAFSEVGGGGTNPQYGYSPNGSLANKYLQITLPSAKIPKQLLAGFWSTAAGTTYSFTLKATNDSTWNDSNVVTLASGTANSNRFITPFNFETNQTAYKYYRVYFSGSTGAFSSGYGVKLKLLGVSPS